MFDRDELRYLVPMVCAYMVGLCSFGVAWTLGTALILRVLEVSDPDWLMVAGFIVGLPAWEMGKAIRRDLLTRWYGGKA